MEPVFWFVGAPVVVLIAVVLLVANPVNTLTSFYDNVMRMAGRRPKPATSAQVEENRKLLEEIMRRVAPEGGARIQTDALAEAATSETADRLRETIELQDAHREREAIDVLYEAFRRDLEPPAKARLHLLIGNSFLMLSEIEEAEGHYRQSLDLSREAGDRLGEANQLGNLGLVYGNRGDLDRAEQHLRDALAIQQEIGDRLGEANQLGNLGGVAADRGEREEACRLLQEAAAIFEEVGAARELEQMRESVAELGCE